MILRLENLLIPEQKCIEKGLKICWFIVQELDDDFGSTHFTECVKNPTDSSGQGKYFTIERAGVEEIIILVMAKVVNESVRESLDEFPEMPIKQLRPVLKIINLSKSARTKRDVHKALTNFVIANTCLSCTIKESVPDPGANIRCWRARSIALIFSAAYR